MKDIALETAHNPAAPQDEREDAMRVAQSAAMPSSVPDLLPLVQYVQQQYQEEQFTKALRGGNPAPNPSRAARSGENGMQSVWLDDQRIQTMGQWYERPSAFGFDTMRQMVDNTPILASVILTRQRQIKRFCRVQSTGKGPGFAIQLKDPAAKLGTTEQKAIQMLESFFTNCGWENNPRQRMRLKRDNFSGFMAKHVRDSLIMDSAPIETEYKRDKKRGMDGFYAVDGSTIRLCSEVGYEGNDEIFALQVVEGQIRTAYSYDDLIYVPRNPRTEVQYGGYGMSETELLIRVVTGYLNAFTYNTKYFDSNAIPKGMLHLTGDYDQSDIAAFKRYWNAMVKGINNAWALPVMVSKNSESKAAFEKFGVDVDDVMFAKWMTFLTSIICAVYGMAPDEINFESFTAGSSSSLSGSDTEEKLIHSNDKGLRPLLAHFEDVFSDFIVADFGDQFVFRWTGLDEEKPETVWDKQKSLLSVNEARKLNGYDETKASWGDAPLNPALMGAYSAEQGEGQEDYGQPGGYDLSDSKESQEDFGDPEGEGKGSDDVDDADTMAKSFGIPLLRIEP